MSYQLSATDQQIQSATSLLVTYGGLALFILGIVGNTFNVFTFTCLKVYRSLSTSAFLTASSLSGQIFLSFTLFRAALANLLGFSAVSRNSIFCRASLFLSRITVQISLTCLCLSAIHRYLMTSRSARQRTWFTPLRARLGIVLSVLIWCGYGVPNAIYAINIPFLNLCVPTTDFGIILTYINLIFAVLLPISVLCVFGFLTWKNLNNARLSSMNVQVTRMILLDVLVVTISNLPMACFLIYAVSATTNRLFTPVETLLINLAQLLSSIQTSGSFYFYLLISPAFRNNVKTMLLKILCCGNIMHRPTVGIVSAVGFMPPTRIADMVV